MTESSPQPDTINKLEMSVYSAFAMLAGMQLDLFTPLKDGPMSAEQVAKAINVGVYKLKPLLYALVNANFLTLTGELFANTPEANHFLVRGRPSSYVDAHAFFSGFWQATLMTAESIRTGIPQASPERRNTLEAYFSFIGSMAWEGSRLATEFDFSPYKTVIDAGGGLGGVSVALTEAWPHLRATVVDLPEVMPFAQRYIAAANAAERVAFVAADLVGGPLTGSFDVAILCRLLHVLSPEQARQVLSNLFKVVNSGGVIYILSTLILDNSLLSPPSVVAYSLALVNLSDGGQAYTEQVYRTWLSEAGFVNVERVNEETMIARKPV